MKGGPETACSFRQAQLLQPKHPDAAGVLNELDPVVWQQNPAAEAFVRERQGPVNEGLQVHEPNVRKPRAP
jgi:hypothetical protein